MFHRILLALDAGEAGSVATSFTVALARSRETEVHVVHVNEHLLGRRGLMSESPVEAAEIVAGALRELHAAGVHATGVTYRTTGFDVPAVICDLAECVRADVVVLGSRRRHHLPVLGRLERGTRERIVRRTPLPVLTAPAPLRVGRHVRTLSEVSPVGTSVRS